MRDLFGSGVDVLKISTSIIADICDGDRSEVNDETETGEQEACVAGGKSNRNSSIMADS
jgi:hypothetical protein